MNTRNILLFAGLLMSSNAFAWSVPIHLADFNPGPHTAGDPIPCSYTNDDGQTFNGTVTSGPEGVMCSGFAEPPTDDTIAAEAARMERAGSGETCDVVEYDNDQVDIECDEVVEEVYESPRSR